MCELRLVKLELHLPPLCCGEKLLKVLQVALKGLFFGLPFTSRRTNVAIIDKDREKLLPILIANKNPRVPIKRSDWEDVKLLQGDKDTKANFNKEMFGNGFRG